VFGLGVGGEGDFWVEDCMSAFRTNPEEGFDDSISPLMRPSTTALQLKLGAGCPTLTRPWVAIV
jgi:hypothetical protein